jgi:drug/metabolite transporter (DMT)-like permease
MICGARLVSAPAPLPSPPPSADPAAATMTATPSPLRVNGLIALCCVIWGSTWQVIRAGLADLPPLTSAAARFLLAGLLMAALAPWLHRHEGGSRPRAFVWLSVGTFNFAASYALVYVCETVLSGGVSAVIWASFPLLMAGAGALCLNERLRPRQLAGIGTSCGGMVWLFWGDLQRLGPDVLSMALLLLLSPAISTVGTVVLKKYGSGSSSVLVNRNAMLFGAALLTVAAFAVEQPTAVAWSGRGVASVLYLAAVGTCLSFGAYHWCLRWAPANRVSLIAFVTPCISVSIDWLFGLAVPSASMLGAGALIICGVVLVVRRPSRR